MIGEWVKIGGKAWNVRVLEIEESFNILYTEKTGRTLAPGAPMTLDPLGTFYGHKVTFARRQGAYSEFDDLYDFLSKPRYSGITVDIVHGQSTLNYKAYVSSGSRSVKQINDKSNVVLWDTFQADFVPMKAQVIPE